MHVHLVFVTKYRGGALTAEVLDTCREVMDAVCRDFGAELVEFGGEEDHVHLLVHYPPTVQVSRLVNSLKGVSSRMIRKEHWGHVSRFLWKDALWSPSYFASSAGGAPLSVVREYILNQKAPE